VERRRMGEDVQAAEMNSAVGVGGGEVTDARDPGKQ